MPHDTPVDTPAVSLIEAPALPVDAIEQGTSALARARETESIEAAYEAWREISLARVQALQSLAEERRRIEDQGSLLLGAMRVVDGPSTPPGLNAGSELARPANPLELRLTEALQELDALKAESEARFTANLAAAQRAVEELVERRAKLRPPTLTLMVRNLGATRRILHAARPSNDDAVLLLYALQQRIPSRYDFLFDDSTDDVRLAPNWLYSADGAPDARPANSALLAYLNATAPVWPVKTMIPHVLPTGLMRWLERGAVMEAEIADGEGFRNVLTTEEAEQIMGRLLALRLEGRIGVELSRG